MSYQTGICGCTSDGSGCCDVILCLPCQASRQWAASDPVDPRPDECRACPCFLATLGLAPLLACMVRRRVAERFDLAEGCCISTMCGCGCGCCSLCQTHRELAARQTWPGGTLCQRVAPSPHRLQ